MKHLFAIVVALLLMCPSNAQAQEADAMQHYVAIAVKPEKMPACDKTDCDALFQETIDIIERRFGGLNGPALRQIEHEGDGRIGMVVAGDRHIEILREVLGIRQLEFLIVNDDVSPELVEELDLPKGTMLLPFDNPEYEEFIVVYRDGGITGDHIIRAIAGFDSHTNMPVVNIEFDEVGTRKFAGLTAALVGKRFAIVLDDKVLSAPRINEPIMGGMAQISASQSYEETNKLAIAIGSGTLPIPFLIVEDRMLGE